MTFAREGIEQSIPEAIERQVRRNQGAAAVRTQREQLTYGELWDFAGRVAGAIGQQEASSGRPAAVLCEQGCELIAAIVGVLRSGRLYVPLDPRRPEAWRRVLLDSEAAAVVCDAANEAKARELTDGLAAVCIGVKDGARIEPALPDVSPDSPAYLYNTSGSTGQPKGVLDNHRNVLHNVRRYVNSLKIGAGDQLTLVQPPSFSGAVSSMFSALATGACLYPIDPLRASPAELGRWVIDERLTMWHSTPSLFRLLCSGEETFPDVRVVRLEGDRATPGDIALYRQRFAADSVLVNGLGATETGIVRQFFLSPATDWNGAVVPVGYPVEDMQVEVVDEAGAPILGQAGEVVVRSRYLARGYWRRPELTASRFTAAPGAGGVRSYRTGDLGKMSADGCLELLGRNDERLKIRGAWAPAGEMEAALAATPGVAECVVSAVDGSHGEKRLAVYFTASRQPAPTASALRRRLAEKFPDAPIPSVVVELDALPLTENGKLDRRALPGSPRSRPALESAYRAPSSVLEKRLAAQWKRVLELDEIGVDDDLFELGGDSLDAVRLAAAVDATPSEVLAGRTIRQLAELLAARAAPTPPPAALSARIESLSPAKRALLERRLRAAKLQPRSRDGQIPRAAPRFEYPLSFTQQRLWFFEQLMPGTSTYNIRCSFRLHGAVDLEALEAALRQLVERHAALRTTFHDTPAGPVQRVREDWRFELRRIAAPDSDSRQAEAIALERLRLEEAKPFELSAEPVFRATAIDVGDQDRLLSLVMHHIVSDGWSLNVITRDLAELYNARLRGRAARLPELPIDYVDHVCWEIEQAQKPERQEAVEYWVNQLAGAPPALALPLDRARPAQPSPASGDVHFAIADRTRREIEELARGLQSTPFMVYLAIWAVTLYRHGAGDDLVIGVPLAGRGREETAHLVGFFANTLGLRIRVAAGESFAELLDRVKGVVLQAMDHQNAPFEAIVERLNPPRTIDNTPVFQTSLAYLSVPFDRLELEGARCELVPVETGDTQFDTVLSIDEGSSGAQGRLLYRASIFRASTAERLVERFLRLIQAAIAQPAAPLGRLRMSSEQERRLLLEEWNSTARACPEETIEQLFERAASRTPERIAIVEPGERISYGELNERAGRIAGALRAAGVKRGDVVGLSIGRSARLIAAMLGVLKAGAAYMPLDVEEPGVRLGDMLCEVGPAAILTAHVNAPTGQPFPAIPLDEALAHEPLTRHETDGARPGDAAAVLFTSGSTGRPKAVVLPHRGVVRLLFGVDYVQLSDRETFLHIAAPAFDASTFEIWGALLHGGCCVVLPQRRPSLREIGDAIREHRVSTAFLTTSLFHTMIHEAPEALAGLRQLVVGGEALSVSHARRAVERLPGVRIVNGYGPTESTTFACTYDLPPDLSADATSVPIGKPIANTEAYVLDEHLEPAPIGVPGELCLGGPGLALEYRGDARLTAEKFVPHPFRGEPGARLYRTGDHARFLSDGSLELLGRRDRQVKIRGFRVELGEIESRLLEHETVAQAVAAVDESQAAGKRLVAYVVPRPGTDVAASDLQEYLQPRLAAYMTPSQIVMLATLPLTPNGKVDRAALPAAPAAAPRGSADEPADSVEETLLAIWRTILRSPQAAVSDDFFDLGGHSLLATKLMARIERELGCSLPIVALFEAPTPRRMATLARRQRRQRPSTPFVAALQPHGSRPPLYCVGAGPWTRSLAESLGDDQPLFGISLRAEDLRGLEAPHRLSDLAAKMAANLARSRPGGPYVLCGWCLDAAVAFETARQLQKRNEDAPLVVLFDPSNPDRLGELANQMDPRVLARRLRFHLGKMRTLSLSKAPGYVAGRARELARRFERARRQAAYERSVRGGRGDRVDVNQAVHAAAYAYRAEPYDGRVVIFSAVETPPERVRDSVRAWERLARGGVEAIRVPGDHYGMLQSPRVETLARRLGELLRRELGG